MFHKVAEGLSGSSVGQFVFITALLINLLTTISVIWLLCRLDLSMNNNELNKFSDTGWASDNEIVLDNDLEADSPMVQDNLQINSIVHESIRLLGCSAGNKAEISLDPEHILLQAKSFGSNEENNLRFNFPPRLERLEVSGPIKNVRAIRPPPSLHSKKDSPSRPKLELKSDEKLELSGNMGLSVHSDNIKMEAANIASIESKEGSIIVRASTGLFLPALKSIESQGVADLMSQMGEWQELELASLDKKHRMCINRGDGMIFHSAGSCSNTR